MIHENGVTLLSDFVSTVLEEPTPERFLSHIVNKTLASLDARGAILGIVEREGFLDLLGTYGYQEKMVDPYMRIPLWTPMPITDAVRSGETKIFRSTKDLVEHYPHLSQFESADDSVTISAPIKFHNTVIGAIGFTSKLQPSERVKRLRQYSLYVESTSRISFTLVSETRRTLQPTLRISLLVNVKLLPSSKMI